MKQTFKYGLRWWEHYPSKVENYFSVRWKPDDLESLRKNLLNDMFPGQYGKIKPGSHKYLHDFEETQSIKAFNQGLTDYDPYNTFEYLINNYGFRGANEPIFDKKNISFFGCSFTFGVGLPEEDHFINMISKEMQINSLNFGIPGGSASRIARAFFLLSNYQKIDLAVFNMPHLGRIEYPVDHNSGDPILVNVVINYKHLSPEEEVIRSKLSDALSDEYLTYDFLRNISLIETVAKLRNIKTVFTSWDIPVHNLLSTYFKDDQTKLLPWFQFAEYKTDKKARDGLHPGIQSSINFTNRSVPYIKKLLNE